MAAMAVTNEDNSTHNVCPNNPPFSKLNEAVKPDRAIITSNRPSKTLVWANLHLSFVKTKPDRRNMSGEKRLVQPSIFFKKPLQKESVNELVNNAAAEMVARTKAASVPIADIVLCLNLSLGSL